MAFHFFKQSNSMLSTVGVVTLLAITSAPAASASVLEDLIQVNRQRAGTETQFEVRSIPVTQDRSISSLQELIENNRQHAGTETQFEDLPPA